MKTHLAILLFAIAISISAFGVTEVNVVTDYGAAGDARQVWVSTTNGSVAIGFTNTLSSGDIGKTIELFGVGQQNIGLNIYNNWSTNYQDLIAVITNVAGNTAYISSDLPPQQNGTAVYCVYGTDNSASFQACVDAASGTNTIINIPAGTFLLIPACQYTNWLPNPDFFTTQLQGFRITKGGLHFVGAGRDATILMADGAWKNQKGWWRYGWADPSATNYSSMCARGSVFIVAGPVSNDFPLVFEGITFDGGMEVGHDGTSQYSFSANPVDGEAWDITSAASQTTGSGLLPSLQLFNNCKFQHIRGEMLKGLTSDPGAAYVVITNCIFTDGNATALNYNPAHTITDCVFSNMFQIEEYYLSHSSVYPSYFINNFVTNVQHNIISLNGGTLTNQPYIISNNVMYCAFNGNAIATCPAANVYVASNTINCDTSSYISVFVIGQSGAQAGSSDALNTNIYIFGNTVSNPYNLLSVGGAGPTDDNRSEGVYFYNNTISGSINTTFVDAGWYSKNVYVYSNDLSSYAAGANVGVACGNGALGGKYVSVQTNNLWNGAKKIQNGEQGGYQSIGLSQGSRAYLWYPYTGTVSNYLITSDSAYFPDNPVITVKNLSAQWDGSAPAAVPVFLNEAMTNSVTIPYGGVQVFYWTGFEWSTNSSGDSPIPPVYPVFIPGHKYYRLKIH